MSKKEINLKIDEIIEFSGIEKFIDTQVKYYSSGMYVRLGFSVSAFLQSDIILLDEVIAVGDAEFQRKCYERIDELKNDGKTVLMVSHNISQIVNFCKRCILLDKGKLIVDGSPNDVQLIYEKVENNIGQIAQKIKTVFKNSKLSVEIDYHFQELTQFPNIGLVVYNSDLLPITGTSLANEDLYNLSNRIYSNKGKLNIEFDNLYLTNGTYFISLWMVDGTHHLEHLPYCDRFIVTDSIQPIFGTGNIISSVKYEIQ